MTRARRLLTISALLLAGSGALAGCAGDARATGAGGAAEPDAARHATADDDAGTGAGGVTVLQPGLPGEEAEVGGEAPAPEPAPWSHADLAFVQMMVPHHAQALEMARLARTRAEDRRVRSLAERIEAAQGPEILLMAAWLDEQGVDVPSASDDPLDYDHGAHGHDGMEGMLAPAEMARLRAARGGAFDRLFLRGMVAHHRGALSMAEAVAVGGTALQVNELAGDVAVGQSAEIARMQELLADL